MTMTCLPPLRRWSWAVVLAILITGPLRGQDDQPRDEEELAWFEAKIRPVLVERCYECHSAESQDQNNLKGSLFVDSREGIAQRRRQWTGDRPRRSGWQSADGGHPLRRL